MAQATPTPSPVDSRRRSNTADRILDVALDAFGTRGYGATSLDDLARELGIRKQTILYWYPSKEALLDAAIDRTADELTSRLERAVARAGQGFDRVDAIVRAMFRLAARHPSMLGFLREVSRLGPPASTRLLAVAGAARGSRRRFPRRRDGRGRMRRHEPRLILLAAYSMVTGLATEVEVLRAFGEEPTLASLVRRRDELLALLRAAARDRPDQRLVEKRLRWSCRSTARRTSSSMRSGYASPDASQSFGYIEIGVNPGMVLTSLTRKPRPRSS